MTRETYTIWTCVDCMFVQANGETEGEPDRPPLGLLDGVEVTLGLMQEEHDTGCTAIDDGGECECETQEFSWRQCEGCGSTLGGSRHAMTVWEKQEVKP